MCGIAGHVTADGAPPDPGLLHAMCAALEHRGPDSRGVHVHGGVGLGIQRLRVIDLETGDQPIFNEDRTVVVVLNGEIYNFAELRSRLRRSGHRFATEGDTEVIVHLYEEEGPACVRSLEGMFAFALWDERRRQLLIARDRVGKKPLFYAQRGGRLTFASELGALVQDPEVSREPDPSALDCFLAYGYVPAPMSIYRAVRKLPPGSTLLWQEGAASIDRYWQLDYSRKRPVGDRREVLEEVREAILGAVRRRLVADVPLGAFLSGGIDSSAVVAAMARTSDREVRTFSIGFDNEEFNELPYARRISELYGTEHHEFVVRPDAIDIAPRLVRHYGEPFADASAIPSFYVAEMTRRHVTVALNGDGGDESFAGYSRYAANLLAARLDRLPRRLRRLAAGAGERIPAGPKIDSQLNRARRLARSLALDPPERYARYMSVFDARQRSALYTDELRAQVDTATAPEVIARPWRDASGTSPVDVMLETDVATYLPDDLLVKMDIASMAHSLEARSPLLDREVMELAASLPAELKVDRLEKKVLLRDAMRDWLPDDILDRPKRGFGVPLASWFRTDLRDWASDVLLDDRTLDRGLFRDAAVRDLIHRHVEGVEDTSSRLWALVMLELWHREFADAPVITTGGARV